MDVRYFYQFNKYKPEHESCIDLLANAIAKVIELPTIVEVCFNDLGKNVYGGIDLNFINRIGISHDIPLDVLPKILTHELIHVHQKHKGYLKIKRDNKCYWHGIYITQQAFEDTTYDDYMRLPWEVDAYARQTKVLHQALELLANPT